MENDNIDILLLTDNSLDTVGGAEKSTEIIVDGLKDSFKFGIIQPGNIKKPKSKIHYYPISELTRLKHLIKKPYFFLKYIFDVKKIIKEEKPKIIHTQAQVSFFIVSLLKKIKLIPYDIKIIHTERGLYIVYSTFFKKLFYFLFNELDVLVVTTYFNLNFWKEALLTFKKDIQYEVIENTAGPLFEKYDENLEKKTNKFVIGFAGRYSDQKNWPLAVKICNKLYEEIPNQFEVIMAVGCLDKEAEDKTNKMFSNLKETLGSNFDGKINVNIQEMDRFYYDIDIFIMTSKPNTESFGRTLIEAMSRKTAVLTTDAGGATEVVEDQCYILNDVDKFIRKITALYENKTLLNSIKEDNLRKVQNKYSLMSNISKHYKLYENLLNETECDKRENYAYKFKL